MRSYLAILLSIAVLGTAGMVYAETCDAGNGCRITCKDGCSAIYNQDTGRCSRAYGPAARALARKFTDLEAKHDITVTVKGLKGYATQEKIKHTRHSEPAKTQAKP
jgi:hypothetical protein